MNKKPITIISIIVIAIILIVAIDKKPQSPSVPSITDSIPQEQVVATPSSDADDQTTSTSPTNSSTSMNTTPTTNSDTVMVTMKTNHGTITLELMPEAAPKTVENFTKLAREGFYDGTRFHRVIAGFMIQGGDPQSKNEALKDLWGTGGPGYKFNDEIHSGNHNDIGTIAMANAGPNTNGSQFFINVADNNFLDTKHTVFGKVTDGMDIVTRISQAKTDDADRPLQDVIVEKVIVQ